MRTDQMLQLGLKCAEAAARGADYSHLLAVGVTSTMGTDATLVVSFESGPWPGDRFREARPVIASVGLVQPSPAQLDMAGAQLHRHPVLGSTDWSRSDTVRVSDRVTIAAFWETEVWRATHGPGDGRFPAVVTFGRFGSHHVFLGVQRSRRDFTDEDMEALDRLRVPMSAALAFRATWDAAAASLLTGDARRWDEALTRREGQVAALVSWGWTDARIARHLGISERTVRKHLENVRAKWQAPNRAAVASLYERRRD